MGSKFSGGLGSTRCDWCVSIWVVKLHEARWCCQWLEAKRLVQGMGVARDEHHSPQPLKRLQLKQALQHAFGKPVPSVFFQDVYIRQVGKRRFVSDQPCESYLPPVDVCADTNRVFDRALDGGQRNTRRPVGGCEKRVDGCDVQAGCVGGNFVRCHEDGCLRCPAFKLRRHRRRDARAGQQKMYTVAAGLPGWTSGGFDLNEGLCLSRRCNFNFDAVWVFAIDRVVVRPTGIRVLGFVQAGVAVGSNPRSDLVYMGP